MDAPQIKAFIDAMAASDLQELEVSHEGWTLRLVRGNGAARAAPAPFAPAVAAPASVAPGTPVGPGTPEGEPRPAAPGPGPEAIRAPMFGIVHLQQAPGEPPFVQVGAVVEAGQMLCTIEAMKVFNEVRADRGGRIAAILVAAGSEVEAGQPLIAIEQVEHV